MDHGIGMAGGKRVGGLICLAMSDDAQPNHKTTPCQVTNCKERFKASHHDQIFTSNWFLFVSVLHMLLNTQQVTGRVLLNHKIFSGSGWKWWPGHGQWSEDGKRPPLLLPSWSWSHPGSASPRGSQQATEGAPWLRHHPPHLLSPGSAQGSLQPVPRITPWQLSSHETTISGTHKIHSLSDEYPWSCT